MAKAATREQKPSKKEISRMRESARKKRKQDADARRAAKQPEEKPNPITVVTDENGSFSFKGRSYYPTRDKNKALEPYGKVLFQTGVQYQIIPDDEQRVQINRTIGCARVVRNDYLAKRIQKFKDTRETLNPDAYKKDGLKTLKEEKPYLRDVDKFALEAAVEFVHDAYQNFFDGNGNFPKFANKFKPNGNRYTTKYTNNNIHFVKEPDGTVSIKLPKVGKVHLVVPHDKTFATLIPMNGRITKATVTRDGQNYLVSLAVEAVIDRRDPLKIVAGDRVISMDMGLKRFCTYGNGTDMERVDNPRWIKKHEKRLRRFQQSLSRKQYDLKEHKGSKNWEKAKLRVAREQRKIANQRKDFAHKLSRKVADACDVFICEDLNIKGMMQNRHLSKAIASVGWGTFLTYVQYKVERNNGIFLKVNRFYPSSKLCECGYKNTDLKLSDRYWVCPVCKTLHDRDDHAVQNLRKEGIRLLAERGISVA